MTQWIQCSINIIFSNVNVKFIRSTDHWRTVTNNKWLNEGLMKLLRCTNIYWKINVNLKLNLVRETKEKSIIRPDKRIKRSSSFSNQCLCNYCRFVCVAKPFSRMKLWHTLIMNVLFNAYTLFYTQIELNVKVAWSYFRVFLAVVESVWAASPADGWCLGRWRDPERGGPTWRGPAYTWERFSIEYLQKRNFVLTTPDTVIICQDFVLL